MLLDTNIIIYAAQGQHPKLVSFVAQHAPLVSVISYVEALGYHRLPPTERRDLEVFFNTAKLLDVSRPVVDQAVILKQVRKMSLGDSIIAATALVHGLTLVTRNVADFQWISGLKLLNPL